MLLKQLKSYFIYFNTPFNNISYIPYFIILLFYLNIISLLVRGEK